MDEEDKGKYEVRRVKRESKRTKMWKKGSEGRSGGWKGEEVKGDTGIGQWGSRMDTKCIEHISNSAV